MIRTDQPTTFGDKLIVALSSVDDGNMKYGIGDSDKKVDSNRKRFLDELGIAQDQMVIWGVSYETDSFLRYVKLRSGVKELDIDGVATNLKNKAIFLLLGDCVGAVMYDPKKKVMMVSHLGRQSTEQYGAKYSVEFMKEAYGSEAKDIMIWLGPSPNKDSYPLWKFNNRSLQEVNIEHFVLAGVRRENIVASDVDTITNKNYFSHSEFLKGDDSRGGRFAIVAMMR